MSINGPDDDGGRGPRASPRRNSLSRCVPLLADEREEGEVRVVRAAPAEPPGFFQSDRVFQMQFLAFFVLGVLNNMSCQWRRILQQARPRADQRS